MRREAAAPKSNPTSISTALAHTKKSLRQPALRLPLAVDKRITPAHSTAVLRRMYSDGMTRKRCTTDTCAFYDTCALHDTCARHGAPKSSPVRAVSASAERVWVRTLRAAENSEGRTVEWYLGTHGQGRCRNTGPPGPESSQCLSAGMKFEPHRNGG